MINTNKSLLHSTPLRKPLVQFTATPNFHQYPGTQPNKPCQAMMRKKHNTTLPVICSNKISNIHWHLINLCAVILFYVSQYADVILAHEIDRHTLKHHTNSASRHCNLQINSLLYTHTHTKALKLSSQSNKY